MTTSKVERGVRNDRVERTLSLLKRQRMTPAALMTAHPPPRYSLLARSFLFTYPPIPVVHQASLAGCFSIVRLGEILELIPTYTSVHCWDPPEGVPPAPPPRYDSTAGNLYAMERRWGGSFEGSTVFGVGEVLCTRFEACAHRLCWRYLLAGWIRSAHGSAPGLGGTRPACPHPQCRRRAQSESSSFALYITAGRAIRRARLETTLHPALP
jgi:hypothetical protein